MLLGGAPDVRRVVEEHEPGGIRPVEGTLQRSHLVAREAEHRDDVSKPAHRLDRHVLVDAVHAGRRAGRAEEAASHDFRNYTE